MVPKEKKKEKFIFAVNNRARKENLFDETTSVTHKSVYLKNFRHPHPHRHRQRHRRLRHCRRCRRSRRRLYHRPHIVFHANVENFKAKKKKRITFLTK